MKKNKKLSIFVVLVLAGFSGYLFIDKENLPKPTTENLEYIKSQFDDLTLEESIQKIKEESESALAFSEIGNGKKLYNSRKNILSENTRYEKKFHPPSPDEYRKELKPLIDGVFF